MKQSEINKTHHRHLAAFAKRSKMRYRTIYRYGIAKAAISGAELLRPH